MFSSQAFVMEIIYSREKTTVQFLMKGRKKLGVNPSNVTWKLTTIQASSSSLESVKTSDKTNKNTVQFVDMVTLTETG